MYEATVEDLQVSTKQQSAEMPHAHIAIAERFTVRREIYLPTGGC